MFLPVNFFIHAIYAQRCELLNSLRAIVAAFVSNADLFGEALGTSHRAIRARHLLFRNGMPDLFHFAMRQGPNEGFVMEIDYVKGPELTFAEV
jgi:hypothetical protein